jgi:hypothetical protein
MAKLGKGEVSSRGALAEQALLSKLSAYRKVISSNYIMSEPDDIDKKLSYPLLVSTKVDGELWYLIKLDNWSLVSPAGRIISGEIEVLIDAEKANLDPSSIYAGELHVIGTDRSRVGDVSALISQGADAETSNLALGVFDLVLSSSLSAIGTPYSQRYEALSKIPITANLFPINSNELKSPAEVRELFDQVQSGGGEGLVARADDGRNFKVKPVKDIDVAILGFTERREADGGMLVRSLLFGLLLEDGNWVPIATTGNVGTSEFRKELFQILTPLEKPSSYRLTSDSSGIMYKLVTPAIVVELKCLDFQVENSRGNPIRDPKLEYSDSGWRVSGWANSVAVHGVAVLRIRSDKSINVIDVGWSQIDRYIKVENNDETTVLGQSKVLTRRVWTKTSSSKVDVRKLVIWKTNKEAAGYPAYVVHWTDYSATRKSPLDREVRLAPTESAALAIAENMIVENIKKGWNEVTK